MVHALAGGPVAVNLNNACRRALALGGARSGLDVASYRFPQLLRGALLRGLDCPAFLQPLFRSSKMARRFASRVHPPIPAMRARAPFAPRLKSPHS